MTLLELKRIVAAGENERIEFKRKAAHPDKIMKEVVAFANSIGGLLLIGIDDNRTIPGLPNPDEEEFIIENAIRKYCKPAIEYTIFRVKLSERLEVSVFDIKAGKDKPYAVLINPTPQNDEYGKVYVRVADHSIQASREVRDILKMQTKQRNFRFEYGDKERLLMQYLAKEPFVTVDIFASLANIPRKQAARTLVLLTLSGVLKIFPDETADRFVLVEV
jgi:predicted HTH transcriptional regulator